MYNLKKFFDKFMIYYYIIITSGARSFIILGYSFTPLLVLRIVQYSANKYETKKI